MLFLEYHAKFRSYRSGEVADSEGTGLRGYWQKQAARQMAQKSEFVTFSEVTDVVVSGLSIGSD